MALWHTFLRILQHRRLDTTDIRKAVPPMVLGRLESRVSASEQRHTGEIRIYIEAGLPWRYLWRNATARERAIMLFGKLRVWDTEHNNGVLIYLLLAERRIELVADRGLNPYVSAQEWQGMVANLGMALQAGNYEEGLIQALDAVSAALAAHFPLHAGMQRRNELPDMPAVAPTG